MSKREAVSLPYVALLGDRDPVAVLRETPRRVSDLLRTMTAEQIEGKPAAGKWSVREVVCHLADCEVAWGWRMRLIYGSDNPLLQPFDQNTWARAYQGDGYTTSAATAAWSGLRQWNLALIGSLNEQQRERSGEHPELGTLTLWNVVQIAAGHDLHHQRAVETIAAGPFATGQ